MRSVSITAGFLAFLAAPSAAYIRFNCATNIVEERADPIVDPLKVSKHAHKIVGGNAFDMKKNMTFEQARASTCSSCTIKQDLSNYWTPKLYYHAENGSFISVPMVGDNNKDLNGGMVVYYQWVLSNDAGLLLLTASQTARSRYSQPDRVPRRLPHACW